jgi:hypothetical protein
VNPQRKTDAGLADQSDRFIEILHDLKALEDQKRQSARSSPEFHELAQRVEETSRLVFQQAELQRRDGEQDSPDARERAESYPGDWTDTQTG